MSAPVRILIGLAAGLAVGLALASLGVRDDSMLVTIADTIGGLWIAALRMTILPLVFALVVTGVASSVEASSAGSVTRLSFAVFAVILLCGVTIIAFLVPAVLVLWPASPSAAEAVRHAVVASEKIPHLPGLGTMLRGFIPTNVFSAAAADNMLPVVFFALIFGFAIAAAETGAKQGLSNFFEWIREAMLTIVRWILIIAPAGVFALAIGLGAKTGIDALGALGQYIVLMVAAALLATVLSYGVASAIGGFSPLQFARAALTPQSIAVSTRSSVATLPAMLSACNDQLRLPLRVTSVTLPLAVSVFRICGPMASFTAAIYAAHVLGIQIGPWQLVIGGLIAIIIIAAGAGVPGEVSFFATYAPIFNAMGIPIEILVLLIAVEAIPDMFQTVANVSMDMAAATVVGRLSKVGVTIEEPKVSGLAGE